MEKTKQRTSKDQRWLDILAVLLLFSMITTAVARLSATRWVENLGAVHPISLFAIAAGLALGYSQFSGRLAWLFGLFYGAFVVPWQIGQLLFEGVEWRERIFSMAGRLGQVIGELFARKPVTDNIFFLYLMGSLFWVLAAYAGFHLVRRGNAWLVILPAGVATLVVHLFDPLLPQRAWYLAVYIFLGLLIVSRLTLVRLRREWAARRFHVPPDAPFDLTRTMVIFTMLLVLLAWNFPGFTNSLPVLDDMYKTISQPFFTVRDRFSYMFAALRSSVGLISDYYSDQQGLGQGQPKSDSIIMTVEGPLEPYTGSRFYWRARVYDEFSNGLWKINLVDRRLISPSQPDLLIGDSEERLEEIFVFKPMQPIISLYAPPQPVWFSRPGQIQYALNNGPGASAGEIDMVGMRADPYLRSGDVYQVRSRLSSITERDLRSAGEAYPQWVVDRYLQVPETITGRTRALVEQITDGLETPYDKAQAVTAWLRANIQYSETIDAPPANQDLLDWFLFDYRIGFCNYYATAEVIMLRMVGVPARWAVGYAQGEMQAPPNESDRSPDASFGEPLSVLYLVRESDAHSWPEVYFPEIGWIEFEPTVSQAPIERASSEPLTPTESTPPEAAPGEDNLPGEEESGALPEEPIDTTATDQPAAFNWREIIGPLIALVAGLVIIGFALFVRQKQDTFMVFWVKMIGGDEQLVAQWQAEKMPLMEQIERTLAQWIFAKSNNQMRLDGQPRAEAFSGLPIPGLLKNWAAYVLLPSIAKAFHEVNRLLQRLGNPPRMDLTPQDRVGQLIAILPEAQEPAQELLKEYQVAIYSQHAADSNKARFAAMRMRRIGRQIWWRRQLTRILNKLRE